WISHFDGKNKKIEEDINNIKTRLDMMEEEIIEIKEALILTKGGLFKQKQTAVYKQTGAVDVQTGVQTAVQTGIFNKLTRSERTILLALLYSEMKLSYEDLASMLGKDKSTIRGQINAIKQKSEGLIEEITEENGKKRVFIPEERAKSLIKILKVRVKNKRKDESKS
ncbi:MAG: MarR family transcriptional regulator, partial [Candidatus Omnitrophica bacterium]|nr:MarR family transcriptional regulator [Candidatus Omnitrophota bacterium]